MRRILIVGLQLALLLSPRWVCAADQADDAEHINTSFSWIQWWEANRQVYFRKAIQKHQLRPPEPGRALKGKVVSALSDATHDPSREVRAEAALALARIGEGADRLAELTRDSDQRVRCRTWVGLGLLQRETLLLDSGKLDDVESLAVITGMGLLDKPGPRTLDRVRSAAGSATCPEVQRMAIWALRVYHNLNVANDPNGIDNALLIQVLNKSDNPAVVSEALLAMGSIGGTEHLPLLLDVVQFGNQTLALPAFARLMKDPPAFGAQRAGIGAWQMRCMASAACLAIAQLKETAKPNGKNIGADNATASLNILRTYAFKTTHGDTVANIGSNNFMVGNAYFPGLATLALGRLGDTASLDRLLVYSDLPPLPAAPGGRNPRGANPQQVGRPNPDGIMEPQRGYAAIAIGLHGGSVDSLRTCAMEFQTPEHLRAACVLGMGLTGDAGNAAALMQLADKLDPKRDQLLYGFIVQSLGLLHDPHTLAYAGKFGLAGVDRIDSKKVLASDFELAIHFQNRPEVPLLSDMDSVLGTRAALAGIALMADDRAAPALLSAWGSDQWISLAAASAMGSCGIYDGVDPMLALLKQTRQQNVQAWSARCVGEMLDQSPRLIRLTDGNLFVYPIRWTDKEWIDLSPAPNGRQREFSKQLIEREFPSLANPLLYWQILPIYGGKFVPPWPG